MSHRQSTSLWREDIEAAEPVAACWVKMAASNI